jgi:alpha-L-rhamnosidase
VPHVWGSRPADPAWGTAYPLLVWYLYRYLGDVRVVEEQYDGLKKYVDYLRTREEDGLVAFSYYGDWVSIEPTPGSLVSAFFYLYDVEIVRDLAKVLGREADARTYGRLAEGIRTNFQKKYYDPKTGRYAEGSQTAQTLPLFLDLPGADDWGRVFDVLRNNVLYEHDTHLTTGIMGAKFILDVLTRAGSADLAYELAGQRTYPSWGYMIECGATTLWELWENKTGPSMNSHNHPMFGSVGAWLYKALAGIDQAEGSVGFEKLRLAPQVVRDLTHASGSIETLRGPVSVEWDRGDKSLKVEVVIPVNSRAEVVLPVWNLRSVVLREGEAVIWSDETYRPGDPGIVGVKADRGRLVVSAGSGRYVFELRGE